MHYQTLLKNYPLCENITVIIPKTGILMEFKGNHSPTRQFDCNLITLFVIQRDH